MKIMPSEDLRERLGLGNVDTFITAAENATEEATAVIASDLRSPLVQSDYLDLYILNAVDVSAAILRFKTTAGFMHEDDFHVGTGMTAALAAADSSLTENAVVKYEEGQVVLTDGILQRYVSIRYTAGFGSMSAPDQDVLDLSDAPDWLSEAGLLKASFIIGNHPELKNKDGKILDVKEVDRQYWRMIEPKVRYQPGYRIPL